MYQSHQRDGCQAIHINSSSIFAFGLSFFDNHCTTCPYPILSIIFLYNKEVVSFTPCSLSVSASRVASRDADAALYNFELHFLKMNSSFIICFWEMFFQAFWSFLAQSRPLNQCFLMIYTRVTFVSINLNQRFLMRYSTLIFVCLTAPGTD